MKSEAKARPRTKLPSPHSSFGQMEGSRMEKLRKRDTGKKSDQPPPVDVKPVRTLAVDIGATGIKALILNEIGEPITERARLKTPDSGMPGVVMDLITSLAEQQGEFDRVSVGFPGVVRDGVVREAPNLADEWDDFNIAKVLSARLHKPVRVANDADVQGFGAISGTGVELVLTLGTGVGSALFVDGRLVPNVEVGKDKLNDEQLKKVGKKKWNKRLAKAIEKLEAIFHYDRLYIGGGNSKAVDISALPANVTIVSNLNGLVGGLALWREQQIPHEVANPQKHTGT
jgi:polyphosphate glucokinase